MTPVQHRSVSLVSWHAAMDSRPLRNAGYRTIRSPIIRSTVQHAHRRNLPGMNVWLVWSNRPGIYRLNRVYRVDRVNRSINRPPYRRPVKTVGIIRVLIYRWLHSSQTFFLFLATLPQFGIAFLNFAPCLIHSRSLILYRVRIRSGIVISRISGDSS